MYKINLTNAINKILRDEISASISYKAMSEITKDEKLTKALTDHSDEEHDHFNKILGYCLNHSIEFKITLDDSVVNNYPTEDAEIISFVQHLEETAIKDYKAIVLSARAEGDIETEYFFEEIMEDEMSHFDELSSLGGKTRDLNVKPTNSFKDYIK